MENIFYFDWTKYSERKLLLKAKFSSFQKEIS